MGDELEFGVIDKDLKFERCKHQERQGESTLTVDHAVKRAVKRALIINNGHQEKTAKTLGISTKTLRNKINKYKSEYDYYFIDRLYITSVENEGT